MALVDRVQTWRYSVDARQFGFFLAKKRRKLSHFESHDSLVDEKDDRDAEARPKTPKSPSTELGFEWVIDSLASYDNGFFDVPPEDRFICFADPSTYLQYPGWMLRNLLVLIRIRWKLKYVQILSYRDTQARREEANSLIFRVRIDESGLEASSPGPQIQGIPTMPKVTGWERSVSGKVASRVANLGDHMDPNR